MTYKLYYWNVKALGEPIRLLLSYGHIEFEDYRIDYKDWSKWKHEMPMGQIPVLEINGKQIHQSIAICRYLAKKVGLSGDDDFENFEIDCVVDTVNDLRQKIATVHYEKDLEVQAVKRKQLEAEAIPFYMRKLEEIASENCGHLALKRTTWADLYFIGMIDYLSAMALMDLTMNCPNLKKLIDETSSIESLKKWIQKRLKTVA